MFVCLAGGGMQEVTPAAGRLTLPGGECNNFCGRVWVEARAAELTFLIPVEHVVCVEPKEVA